MLLLCVLHFCTFRKTRRPSCLIKCYSWNSISWTGTLVNKSTSLMEYALCKAVVHKQPITSSPKNYAGSSLVEYAIWKASGHKTPEKLSAQPFIEYGISKAIEQKPSLTCSPREKIWSCDIHNKHYLNSFQYETHLKQAHQGNYKCTSCRKSYMNSW